MIKNKLLYYSKQDIPFPGGQISIHNPTIREIALIGEDAFFMGCQLLNFSKEMLNISDKTVLEQVSNFEILMSVMNQKDPEINRQKAYIEMILLLLFPAYQAVFLEDRIALIKTDENNQVIDNKEINANNFEEFKKILQEMFSLKDFQASEENYNPVGDYARQIADRLNRRKKKLAEKNGNDKEELDIFIREISILSVGLHLDVNDLMEYTVFQLSDEFQRFQLNQAYSFYIKAKMAGASGMKEVDDWTKDLYSNKKQYDF